MEMSLIRFQLKKADALTIERLSGFERPTENTIENS